MAKPTREDDANQVIRLCQLIGYCLQNFSRIEESLAALFGTAAGVDTMEAAFKTHDAIREFQYRLDATDAVVRLWVKSLEDKSAAEILSKEWNALYGVIKDDASSRNKVAHFSIAHEIHKDGRTAWYVVPYFQMYSHISFFREQSEKITKLPPGPKFDANSMEAKGDRFLATSKRIDRFIGEITVRGAQLPKWSADTADTQE